ncbi:MAG: hypothetical protein K0R84_422 [Clostridia bacterium]|jgi:hypothetical protein|nr:hypothetical protein [Clostridia bacterium]
MVNWIVLFLYSLLFFVAVCNVIAQYSRRKIINAFMCFQSAFILYYIFIPIVVNIYIKISPGQLDGFTQTISHADSYDVINTCIYTMIAYSIILFTYYTKRPSTTLDFDLYIAENLSENQIDYWEKRICSIAVAAGIITLIIGVAAELYIVNSLGGILKALAMGDRLRAFGSDRTYYLPQNRLFILILMVSPLASTYFFAYALRIYRRFSLYLLLILSFIASTFYLIFNAGRLGIFLYISTFLIDYVYRKSKHPFGFVGLLLILGVSLLERLDDLFFYLSYGYIKLSSPGIISIINEFSFPYLNLLNAFKINEIYGLRWGVDFVSWVINIVPTRILEIFGLTKVTSQYMYITEYYSRISTASGGIPTDLLTLGIRQFGVFGILVVSVMGSLLCKYIDKLIDKMYWKRFAFIALRISSIMFIAVAYADLDSFIRNRYDMLVILLFSIAASKIKIQKSLKV